MPYAGAIQLLPGHHVPKGWVPCDGAILRVSEYQLLFASIFNRFGGDGQTTFALPDLRGHLLTGGDNGCRQRLNVQAAASQAGAERLPYLGLDYYIATKGDYPAHEDFSPPAGTADELDPESYFLGDIRLYAGEAAPRGWSFCHGQMLPGLGDDNRVLYALLGNRFGGDHTSFALPDLRGRVPVGSGDRPMRGGETGVFDPLPGGAQSGSVRVESRLNYMISLTGMFPS